MNCDYILLWLCGILTYFAVCTVARESIVGGEIVPYGPITGEFRYMVALLKLDYGYFCSGSLIGEQHVLSAARCFINHDHTYKTGRVFALMGTRDLMHMTGIAVNMEVVKIYYPIEFNATDPNSNGDIAILKLSHALNIVNRPALVQAKKLQNSYESFAGKKAIVAGWGWNTVHVDGLQVTGRRTDSLLRFAIADVLSREQCQHMFNMPWISPKHLCARIEQQHHRPRGVCHGDEGSPLMHDGFVIGVLSKFPFGCTEVGTPAVYTRVSHYLAFIRNAKTDHVPPTSMKSHVLVP